MTKPKVDLNRIAFELAMSELKLSERLRDENYKAHEVEAEKGSRISKIMADYNEGYRDGVREAIRVLSFYFDRVGK